MNGFKPGKIILTLLAVLIVGGAGYGIFKSFHKTSASDKIGTVIRQDLIQTVTIAGKVTPKRATIIYPPFSGYIKKFHVSLGEEVKVGAPLVSMVQALRTSAAEAFPIPAPFAGTIVQINSQEGEYLRETDVKSSLLRLDDLSELYVDANVPEIDVGKLKVGQDAIVKATAILDKSYKGVIREISLASRTKDDWGQNQVDFQLRIQLINPDESLKSGMSVVADIVTQRKEKVLTLRHEFIQKKDDGNFVTLATGKEIPVTLGIQNEESVEIVEGIQEGNKVQQTDFLSFSDT